VLELGSGPPGPALFVVDLQIEQRAIGRQSEAPDQSAGHLERLVMTVLTGNCRRAFGQIVLDPDIHGRSGRPFYTLRVG